MAYIDDIRFPSFKIILIFVCLTLMGLFLIPQLPFKLAPKEDLPQLSISFSMPDMQSRVVEMEVTSKLESILARVKGVEHISSSSGNGWGRVDVKLNKKTPLDVARFEISTFIRQLYPSLPENVSYPIISGQQSNSANDRTFLTYSLNAPSSPVLIQEYAENAIKNKLSYLEGVDAVTISGATQMIWKLEYDFDQLQRYNLKVEDIQRAIRYYLKKENLGVGLVESGGTDKRWTRIAITPKNQSERFETSEILVRNHFGKLIRLDELVTISHIEEEPYSYYRINGLNSVYLTIEAKEKANQLKLAGDIKKELKKMEKHFPPNYEIHLVYDSTGYIQDELNKILFRSGLTILILMAFVLLIYRNLKYLLMITVSLVSNLAIAVVFYKLLHIEMHLYSLMGITISLSLMLDNIIVMSDQIHRQRNRKAFLAILTATLTTIAALVMIFFMDEKIRLNLEDFAVVILINLSISLLVVLFLVPALTEKIQIPFSGKKSSRRSKRRNVRFNRFYKKLICFTTRKKTWVLTVGILIFGLPVFMLPKEIKPKQNKELSKSAIWYNKTLGAELYQEKIKPVTDVALGGTLRLFVEKVFNGSYWKNNGETMVNVYLSMPNGTTLDQTNHLISRMEEFIRKSKGVYQFQTNVQKQYANISIRFKKECISDGTPYKLYNELIGKGIELGGGSWSMYAAGDAFSNEMRENAGQYRIKMMGYNYDNLYAYAQQVRDTLLQLRRIDQVTINSEFSWYKNDYQEYTFKLNKDNLIREDIHPEAFFGHLDPMFGKGLYSGDWVTHSGNDPILLYSKQAASYDIWQLNHLPGKMDQKLYRLSNLASIEKFQAPQVVARENQEYQLCLQYEYLGSGEQGDRILARNVEKMGKLLPIGYSIKSEKEEWGLKENRKQYLLLLVVILIIYFTTSILFNSLKQPMAILLIIPVSFIGLFMTFYEFKLNFDQGGFAAFILLCGITVNAGIYLVNQYNNIQKRHQMEPLRAYIRAWNFRIIPIFLTILSTTLGFVPFLIGEKEGFWFPLAAGTIGGLVMSLVGLFLFLPIYLGVGKK